jgi:preprotein translocase subunit SecD
LTGLVLFQFGTGPIKGFALTLMVGIAASLFTAIVVTRIIFDYFTQKRNIAKLSI